MPAYEFLLGGRYVLYLYPIYVWSSAYIGSITVERVLIKIFL